MENLDNEQVAGEKIKILAINFKKFRWVELSRKGPDKMPSHYLPCNRRQPILLSAQHSLTISRFSRDLARNIASKAPRGVFQRRTLFSGDNAIPPARKDSRAVHPGLFVSEWNGRAVKTENK